MRKMLPSARIVALLTPLALIAGACGDDDDGSSPASSASGAVNDPAASETTASEDEQLTFTMGGTQASSSAFACLSAHARLAGEADGNMTISIRETGTSHENIQLLQGGAIDFGLAGLRTPAEAQKGLGEYERNPVTDLCTVMNFAINAEYITVRADAGIETIYDLDGKSFAPGFQGTGLYDSMLYWFSVLGIEVDVFNGSLEDVVNAIKDGRIVGFGKASAGFAADASMLDVQSTVAVKAIGFTQADIDKVMADDPLNEQLYQFKDVPVGRIYDNDVSFITSVVTTNLFSDTSMPEDHGYRLTKALWAALEDAAAQTNYSGAKGITPDETTATAEMLPICPGAQRYYYERG